MAPAEGRGFGATELEGGEQREEAVGMENPAVSFLKFQLLKFDEILECGCSTIQYSNIYINDLLKFKINLFQKNLFFLLAFNA